MESDDPACARDGAALQGSQLVGIQGCLCVERRQAGQTSLGLTSSA